MKKVLVVLLVTTLLLVGCGNKESKVGFKDNTLTINDFTIKILETKLYPANHFERIAKPTIVIIYDITNTSDKPFMPFAAWSSSTKITQETDSIIEDLEYSSTPHKDPELGKYFSMNDVQLKEGATITCASIYTVKYEDKPIKISFSQGFQGKHLGELIIE